MITKQRTGMISIIFSLFIFNACEDNTNEIPESGTIAGKVFFVGTFPEASMGKVQISLHKDWYPKGPPYSVKEITSSDIKNGIYEYEFNQVAFGTYKAVAVDIDNGSGQYNIWGVYGGTARTGFMDADSLVVSVDNYDIDQINIDAIIQ
ncbi:MAG: hypothetical protein ACKVJJ_00980 [Fidelibacterota bacterium]